FGASGGGFAASAAHLNVNLGGVLTMGTGSFAGSTLILSAANAPGDVDFQSNINLGTGARTIQVDDNVTTGMDFATISGSLSGGSVGITSLTKTGGGNLILSGPNSYVGNTAVTAGALTVRSIGTAGATSSNLGTNVGGGSLLLGSTTIGGTLLYVGPGEVATRTIVMAGTSGGALIDATGSGPLTLANVVNSGAGAKTLTLRGQNADMNMITSTLTDSGTSALSVTKNDGGVWVLAPGTQNTFSGPLTLSAGLLGVTSKSFGTGDVVAAGGGIFAYGGTLTTSANFAMNSNLSFGGSNSIILNGTIKGNSGMTSFNLHNSMDNGAVLTLNNLISLETTATTRKYMLDGYGSTVINGTIANGSLSATGVDVRIANNASLTLSGSSSFTGGVALYQGQLIL
ncbi:MAG: hypothetical protein EBS01_15950, partial [Verrucomicrobia bacterium]|nr:hypothetical protein [Verrucomicrobiota bacterium]